MDWQSEHFDDAEYVELREKIVKDQDKFHSFKIHNNRIFIRVEPKVDEKLSESSIWKIWVPKKLTTEIIQREHDDPLSAHSGIGKTIERIRRLYFWPRMLKQVREYIVNCEICNKMKPPNSQMRPLMGNRVVVERPFQRIYVDLLGPYPRSGHLKTVILIVVDHLTKFVLLKTLTKGTAAQICDYLKNEVFNVYGVPESIHTDNGVQFRSKEYFTLLSDFKIRESKTAYYSPQSNISERVNRSIVIAIRSYIDNNKHSGWDKYISEIACALRSSIHESVKSSPHFLLFGYTKINCGEDYRILREINCLSEGGVVLHHSTKMSIIHDIVKENLRIAFEKSSKQYNLRARFKDYNVGDTVYVRMHPQSDAARKFNSKFAPQFAKAIVTRKLGSVDYELKDVAGKIIGHFHAKDIK